MMSEEFFEMNQVDIEIDLSQQMKDLYDEEKMSFVGSKEEMWEKYIKHPSKCNSPCKKKFSTCFIKEAPVNLLAVSKYGFNASADFSRLHCIVKPCTTYATINIPGCPPEKVKTKLNAVHICGQLGYWFNFKEVFIDGCKKKLDFRTAAGQGSTSVDQVLCYLPECESDCTIDLCHSKISVHLSDFIRCEDKVYLVYHIEFTLPPCRKYKCHD
ncbi:hypothetical protein JTI58_05065 [Lysinibacillus fusiformis]|uniref:hypothetical protein n=1 Tax=Lysinibacillus fusiformis TaxID=28031 RepID=UPI0019673475|nr:hypothetical protein [Lysinibacillus fusiformis]QSB11026.1 hypothetical protein JTI58_05065 [Lysinibacillus fusiformis]